VIAAWRIREQRLGARRPVNVVDAVHLFGVRLDVRQVEVHDDRLLTTAQDDAGERCIGALISRCGA